MSEYQRLLDQYASEGISSDPAYAAYLRSAVSRRSEIDALEALTLGNIEANSRFDIADADLAEESHGVDMREHPRAMEELEVDLRRGLQGIGREHDARGFNNSSRRILDQRDYRGAMKRERGRLGDARQKGEIVGRGLANKRGRMTTKIGQEKYRTRFDASRGREDLRRKGMEQEASANQRKTQRGLDAARQKYYASK